jgi:hypothetical protein
MSVRLDHGEDTLDEVHEINVTPFIDVMLVLLTIFIGGGAAGEPRSLARRTRCGGKG